MIAPLGILTNATVDPAAVAQLDSDEPFAALFAALTPGDGAVLPPEQLDELAGDCTTEPTTIPSPESLLMLVAALPLPAPPAGNMDETCLPTSKMPPVVATWHSRDRAWPPGRTPTLPLPVVDAVEPEPLPSEFRPQDPGTGELPRPGHGAAIRPAALLQQTWPQPAPVQPLQRNQLPPARSPAEVDQPMAVSILPGLQSLGPIAAPAPATAAVPAPAMAQQLTGQLAAALPRLRQSGGEAILTLDPARLGQVTLSWQSAASGGSILTVRAVEPVTAALLSRLGDDIAAMLRADPAIAGAGQSELRIDIARMDRNAEPRPSETGHTVLARAADSDMGQARQHQRAPASPDAHIQVSGRAAVNADDPAQEAVQPRSQTIRPARLA